MARFTVILPEGTVLLKNEATGETLRLSADSGPLVLGEIEMTMTWAPKPLASESALPVNALDVAEPIDKQPSEPVLPDSAFERKPEAPGVAPLTHPVPSPEGLQFSTPMTRFARRCRRGLVLTKANPFCRPKIRWIQRHFPPCAVFACLMRP